MWRTRRLDRAALTPRPHAFPCAQRSRKLHLGHLQPPAGPLQAQRVPQDHPPLTVLRRFDCALAGTKEAVLAGADEYAGDSANARRGILEAAAGRKFYNTSELDFGRLLDDLNQIAQNLNRYIRDFPGNVRELVERFGFDEHIARMKAA